HVLRCARPPRLGVPHRPRHPVFPPRNPSDLLRGLTGRQQRRRVASTNRRRPRHQSPLLHRRRDGARVEAAGRRGTSGAAASPQRTRGVSRHLRRGGTRRRPDDTGVAERPGIRSTRRQPDGHGRGHHLLARRRWRRWRRGLAFVGGGTGVTQTIAHPPRNMAVIKTLTYLMFAMFAMTTDSVGLIIPEIIKTFHLTLTAAGTFQYATMAGIPLAGLGLGTLADRLGHRRTIVIGLTVFAGASFLFAAGDTFMFFVV